jgi:hypothetical protein
LSVDDLRTWQGVVLGRAVSTLRSVETQLVLSKMDLIIKDFYTSFKSSLPSDVQSQYEKLFKEAFSCLDANQLLLGPTPKQKIDLVESAFDELVTANNSNLEISFRIAMAGFTSAMKALRTITSQYQDTRQPPNRLQNDKRVRAPVEAAKTKPNSKSSSHKKSENSAQPEPKTKHQPFRRDQKAELSSEQLNTIYGEIQDYINSHAIIYSKNKHIMCDKPKCNFCTSMAYNVALTRCTNHKKCVPSGWFPHIGGALWKINRKRHERIGAVFKSKVSELHPGELQPLSSYLNRDSSDMESDIISEGTIVPTSETFNEESQDSYQSGTVISGLTEVGSWSDEVERQSTVSRSSRRSLRNNRFSPLLPASSK